MSGRREWTRVWLCNWVWFCNWSCGSQLVSGEIVGCTARKYPLELHPCLAGANGLGLFCGPGLELGPGIWFCGFVGLR